MGPGIVLLAAVWMLFGAICLVAMGVIIVTAILRLLWLGVCALAEWER